MKRNSLIFVGAAGSGKRTLARRAVARGYHHIESGGLLEAQRIEPDTREAGNLVSDDRVFGVVARKFADIGEDQQVIFDGYPRTLKQCHDLHELLENAKHQFALVFIKIRLEEAKRRILSSQERVHRSDDKEETIGVRHGIYLNTARLIHSFWRERGAPVYYIDANDRQEKVGAAFDRALVEEETRIARLRPVRTELTAAMP